MADSKIRRLLERQPMHPTATNPEPVGFVISLHLRDVQDVIAL